MNKNERDKKETEKRERDRKNGTSEKTEKNNTSLLNRGRFQTSSEGNLLVTREDTCTCTWEEKFSPSAVDYGEW